MDALKGEMATLETKLRAEVKLKQKELQEIQIKLDAEVSARKLLEDQLTGTKTSLDDALSKLELSEHANAKINGKLDGLTNRVAQFEEELTDTTLALDDAKVHSDSFIYFVCCVFFFNRLVTCSFYFHLIDLINFNSNFNFNFDFDFGFPLFVIAENSGFDHSAF